MEFSGRGLKSHPGQLSIATSKNPSAVKDIWSIYSGDSFKSNPASSKYLILRTSLISKWSTFSVDKSVKIQLVTCSALLTMFIVSHLCNNLQIKLF